MKTEEFFEILGELDENLIAKASEDLENYHKAATQLRKKQADEKITSWEDEEALKPRIIKLDDPSEKPGKPFKKIMLAVAAVACVAAVGIFIRMKSNSLPVSPNDSADVSSEVIISGGNLETSGISVPENLILDLDLPENTPSTVSQIRLQVRKWKENEIESIFLDGKTVVEKYTYEPDFFPDDLCYVYKTSDNWQIIHAPGQFTANNMAAKNGEFQYNAVCDPMKSLCFASDEELSAFSSKDAARRVNEILDKLNIPYGTPYIIPVKADVANKHLKFCEGRYDDFSYTPWSEENEVYILIYPLVYEGIELAMAGMKVPGANDFGNGASIEAVVSKDDIISLRGRTIFQSEYETEEQISVKYNADYSLNKIKKFYSSQIISEETRFFDCKLVYAPVKKESEECLSFAPAWEFDGDIQTEMFPSKQLISQYVYAHNGIRYSEY